jgi:DNA (cytosine-5)-methyltransferase 1
MVAVGPIANTLTARYGRGTDSSGSTPLVPGAATVRRLTPRECERLQGFPDDWTLTSGAKQQADSARYRQMGNAVPIPMIEWAVRRMIEVDRHIGIPGAA